MELSNLPAPPSGGAPAGATGTTGDPGRPVVLPAALHHRLLRAPRAQLAAVAVHLRGQGLAYPRYVATVATLCPELPDPLLAEAWASAGIHLARTDAHRLRLAELATALDQPWTGSAGATDLALLQAWLRLAARWPGFPCPAPVGELAVLAGVARSTARRGLRRLQADGWLVQTRPGQPGLAGEWQPGPLFARAPGPGRALTVDLGADAGRPGALGKARLRLWGLLEPRRPQTAAALARQLGRAGGTVRKQLAELAAQGVATRTPDGWVSGPASPEHAAARAGVAGARERAADQLAVRRRLRASRPGAPAPTGRPSRVDGEP